MGLVNYPDFTHLLAFVNILPTSAFKPFGTGKRDKTITTAIATS